AAAVHRPRARQRARGAPPGRALLGARPGGHATHRGAAGRAETELFDSHRDAQHAAGVARLGLYRLLLPRPPDRIRAHQATLHAAADERTEAYITGRFG